MMTDRRDPSAASELGDEFWGEQTEWTPQPQPSAGRPGLGATIGRWWNGLLGGDSNAERSHGVGHRMHGRSTAPTPSADPLDEIPGPRPDAGQPVDDDGDDGGSGDEGAWTFEPEPQASRRPGVDPLLARLGGLAVIVTLAAPLVVGFASSPSEADGSDALVATIADAPQTESVDTDGTPAPAGSAMSDVPNADPTPTADGSSGIAAPTEAPAEPDVDDAPDPESAEAASLEATSSGEPSSATTELASAAPSCGNRYDVAAGDYWIRLADAADVSLADLLAVNDASVDTVLVPGGSICLPVGASTPGPPPTVAPPARTSSPNTPAPVNTTAPATTAPNRPPATTVAPAPPAPSRPAAVPTSQAASIIRDVWPDDLEDRALEIAWRESNHRSNVNNWCCYGLFQIHWTAHRSWLATIGVTSASQLYDPVVNATAAYTLYQRAGGFGPWGG